MKTKHAPAAPLTAAELARLSHFGASGSKPDPFPFSVQGERMVVDALGRDVAMVYGPCKLRPQQAAYIAHAANAYPKLVEALRVLAQRDFHPSHNGERWDEGFKQGWDAALNGVHGDAAALLRELGEEA